MSFFEWLNENIIWGAPMVATMLLVGIYLTVKTGFFHIRCAPRIAKETLFSLFKKDKRTASDKNAISQFQAISTALAATIGTGNIAGVATAITLGGPGSVFWMWISAFFGMMTAYGENVLGIYYRKRNAKGEWSGGAMYYLEEGLKGKRFFAKMAKPLAYIFAFFCMFAALGMGNMTQVNTISELMSNTLGKATKISVPPVLIGVLIGGVIGVIIFGGVQRIGRVTEKMVPFMAGLYISGTFVIFLLNISDASVVFSSILSGAMGVDAVAGGISGVVIKKAVGMGVRRGIFSNEAGLGSSVIVGAASDVKEPTVQGMWGIFTVFFDTIIGCTLTAFAILSSGVVELSNGRSLSGAQGAELVAEAFSKTISGSAGVFVAIITVIFAFSTVIGWAYYGMKAAEYLLGESFVALFKIAFMLAAVPGAVLELELVWRISDAFNGLMAVPNLIGVVALSGEIIYITKNYSERVIKGKDYIPAIYSHYAKIQMEQEEKI